MERNRFTQDRLEGTFLDRIWVYSFLLTLIYWVYRLAPHAVLEPWIAVLGFLAGWVLSDLTSGTVHWAGDTWGHADIPLFGPRFIRPFREHHVDPKSITRHDFYDVNGTNCVICMPMLLACLMVNLDSRLGFFGVVAIVALAFWTFATNQIHKWAHQDDRPNWVRLLQRYWLILPTEEHDKHHQKPYENYYCITTGWLNPLIAKTGYFRKIEAVISWVTGAKARAEDALPTA